jgi:Leucine-rich repeat (LRR) protein
MFEYEWDVFISHASEDKESVARPLANHLAGFGLKVWLDESELHLGDSLREKIDAGLAQSRFGLVILSPAFFAKIWTKSELDGLVAKEVDGIKVILPIWHKLGHDEVRQRSPILAGRLAASTSEGLDTVATKIIRAIESSGSIKRHIEPLFEGRLTKTKLFSLPEGSFLLSNLTKPDLTPALAESTPTHHLRESFWEKLTRDGVSKTKFYVFEDAASYRAHMASRNIYVIEEAERVRNRRPRKAPPPDFDIELVRAYVATGKSPPEAWRPLVASLSFDDDKYKFEKIDGLSELNQLERLDLFDIDPPNINSLAKLKKLRWLYLGGMSCNRARNVNALSNLTNLEYLDLNMGGIKNINSLENLIHLKHLNIFCKSVRDISAIRGLIELEFLGLFMTPIRNIEPLRSLSNLRTLDLSSTFVEDIRPLSELHNLQNLSLWKTPVRDLGALKHLENLRTIDIDQTNVKDVAELRGLHNLRFLSAHKTSVRDFSELKHIEGLEIFDRNEPYAGDAEINPEEKWQIWYWRRRLSVSQDDLFSLIAKHGNSVAAIRRAIDRR